MPPTNTQQQGSVQFPQNGGALSPSQIQQARAQIGLPAQNSQSAVSSQWDTYNKLMHPATGANADVPDNSLTAQAHRAGQAVGVDALGTGLGVTLNSALGGSGSPEDLLRLSQQHTEQTQKLVQALKDPNITPDARQHLLAALKGNTDYAQQAYDDVSTAGITDKQVLGSAAQTALDVGTAGLGAGVGETALARIGSAAGKFGALGVAQGAANAYGNSTEPGFGINGTDAGNIVKGGIEGGAAGAILGGGAQALGEAAPALIKGAQTAKQGISDAVSSAKSFVKPADAFDQALEISRPQMTPNLEKQAFAENRLGKQGMFSGAKVAPSASDTKIAEAVQPLVEDGTITAKMAKSDPTAVKSAIDQRVSQINSGVKQMINEPRFNQPFNESQLDQYLQKAKGQNKILFGGDKSIETAYDTVIDEFKNYVKTKNTAGLFDARQSFDQFIKSKYPAVFKPNKLGIINPVDNAKQNALLDVRSSVNEMVADLLDSGKIQSVRKAFEPSTARPLIEKARNFENKADFVRNVKGSMEKYKDTGLPSGTSRKVQTTMNTKNQYPTSLEEDLNDLWDIAHSKIEPSAGKVYANALRQETSLLRAGENMGTKIKGITQKGKVQDFLSSPKGNLTKKVLSYGTAGLVGAGVIDGGSKLLGGD